MNIHSGKHVHDAIRLPILHVHATTLVLVSILCLHPATCLGRSGNETDRLALLEFKAQISLDPFGVLKSWNDSVHFCFWQGVTCSPQHQRVTYLNLRGLNLLGTISPHIGNLSFLRFVNLWNNRFQGELPQELGRLSRLRHLNLTNNKLGGEIPENISYCSELQIMDVTNNRLFGEIPAKLTSLRKLVTLMLPENNLTGEFPQSIGNMSSLKQISVAYNNMKGNIPNEMGQLTSLSFFAIGANNFTGTIPPALYNISSITLISTANNTLNGSIPASIGFTLPNLVVFDIGGNHFYGTIPASLANASYLERLDISANSFTGQVPTNLGYLTALQLVNIEENFLGGNMSEDLNFIPPLTNCSNLRSLAFDINNFGGTLPGAIGNFSTKFKELYLGNNQISGILPKEISNLVNVYVLALLENQFSGTIPSSFGKLENLQLLSLTGNYLSGEIPPSLGNITSLYSLELAENLLEGNIPASLGSCQYLQQLYISSNNLIGGIPPQVIGLSSLTILDLSKNSLTGFLPQEIGKLKNIRALDVSGNKLSGQIPDALGKCLTLEMLYMQDNSLEGSIPSSVVSLVVLQYVDVSKNDLSGNIPEELGTLRFLEYLNLSFNNLDGPVPTKGVFSNASALSLVGNNHLCGGIAELHLPACTKKTKKYKPHKIAVLLPTICSIVLFLAIASFCIHKQKNLRKNPSVLPFTAERILRISYEEVFQATGGFSSDNLIGEGSFGSVYKGKLEQQEHLLVAVKVLKLQQYGASKSFLAECKALRNIRHRNLVKMLTYCSSTDFDGAEFKAIVLQFMENGSLEMWLHELKESENKQSRRLDLLQRLRIATEVASALHYLHDHCEIPIIHCDLKPSNILLDNDMTAKISDFGLSRLIGRNNTNSSQFQSSTTGMKGSIGYMAPEYGAGSEATTNGDVYSFGIILLEMFTGKRPTDEMFKDGLNLHNFVKAAVPERVMEVVDPTLLEELNSTTAAKENAETEIQEDTVINTATTQTIKNYILSVLKIGIACSVETPRNRTNMRDASRELNLLFNGGIRQDRPSIVQLIGA